MTIKARLSRLMFNGSISKGEDCDENDINHKAETHVTVERYKYSCDAILADKNIYDSKQSSYDKKNGQEFPLYFAQDSKTHSLRRNMPTSYPQHNMLWFSFDVTVLGVLIFCNFQKNSKTRATHRETHADSWLIHMTRNYCIPSDLNIILSSDDASFIFSSRLPTAWLIADWNCVWWIYFDPIVNLLSLLCNIPEYRRRCL